MELWMMEKKQVKDSTYYEEKINELLAGTCFRAVLFDIRDKDSVIKSRLTRRLKKEIF